MMEYCSNQKHSNTKSCNLKSHNCGIFPLTPALSHNGERASFFLFVLSYLRAFVIKIFSFAFLPSEFDIRYSVLMVS